MEVYKNNSTDWYLELPDIMLCLNLGHSLLHRCSLMVLSVATCMCLTSCGLPIVWPSATTSLSLFWTKTCSNVWSTHVSPKYLHHRLRAVLDQSSVIRDLPRSAQCQIYWVSRDLTGDKDWTILNGIAMLLEHSSMCVLGRPHTVHNEGSLNHVIYILYHVWCCMR